MFQDFPDIEPSKSGFTLNDTAEVKRNPYNQVETVYGEAGTYWLATLNWAFMYTDEIRTVRGFCFAHLAFKRFYLRDSSHVNAGAWGGNIVVDGGSQDGLILAVRGATPGQLICPAGDRFELGGFLYETTEAITANSSGKAVLRFQPELRLVPADGVALNHADPFGTFMLKEPSKLPAFVSNKIGAKNITIEFQEALR